MKSLKKKKKKNLVSFQDLAEAKARKILKMKKKLTSPEDELEEEVEEEPEEMDEDIPEEVEEEPAEEEV